MNRILSAARKYIYSPYLKLSMSIYTDYYMILNIHLEVGTAERENVDLYDGSDVGFFADGSDEGLVV